jgi:uncharacterized membrane protein YjfL (UPF0719 family)
MEQLITTAQYFAYLSVFAIIIYSTRMLNVLLKRSKYNHTKEIEEGNNLALAFRMAGIYLGTSIGLFGVLDDPLFTIDYAIDSSVEIVMLMVFMTVGLVLNDKFLLKGIDNDTGIKTNTISIGVVELGAMIATGIISGSSFLGGNSDLFSSTVYFILGQLTLILLCRIYTARYKYDITKNIYKGEIAPAILLSSLLISTGIILKTAIEGPFIIWQADIITLVLSVITSILFIVIFASKIIDSLFLPNSSIEQELEDKNPAAILIAGVLKISTAIALCAIII